eukprot:6204607-Pleurochrysis_carterae.AAC.2
MANQTAFVPRQQVAAARERQPHSTNARRTSHDIDNTNSEQIGASLPWTLQDSDSNPAFLASRRLQHRSSYRATKLYVIDTRAGAVHMCVEKTAR